jgi:hypothetical protein
VRPGELSGNNVRSRQYTQRHKLSKYLIPESIRGYQHKCSVQPTIDLSSQHSFGLAGSSRQHDRCRVELLTHCEVGGDRMKRTNLGHAKPRLLLLFIFNAEIEPVAPGVQNTLWSIRVFCKSSQAVPGKLCQRCYIFTFRECDSTESRQRRCNSAGALLPQQNLIVRSPEISADEIMPGVLRRCEACAAFHSAKWTLYD